MKKDDDFSGLLLLIFGVLGLVAHNYYVSLSGFEVVILIITGSSLLLASALIYWQYFSKSGRQRRKNIKIVKDLPEGVKLPSEDSIKMGKDEELGLSVYLPDNIRSRHVHILGATGSGKTESVILNFIKQDTKRGLGGIILDAKGDHSFLEELQTSVPKEKLQVFDLSSSESFGYDPLKDGSPLESAQRLFSSLNWSEQYYKSKSLTALQKIYKYHFKIYKKNPQLTDIASYLEDPTKYAVTASIRDSKESQKLNENEFQSILGLKDQVDSLCTDYLEKTLSPGPEDPQISLEDAKNGKVLYFRLQSLLSPELVGTVGRLLINHLNHLAGSAHKNSSEGENKKLIPTYLDEFASFACQEFADLISKARSAGLSLHFSHQSIGDLTEVSGGFLNKITDNSATKIVLRINDPDSAEYMSRTFGTKLVQKITQRVTNSEDSDLAKSVGEGSTREAHQYRAAPDLLKSLPTGTGSVLIAHGYKTPTGASSVFKINFPKLKEKTV